MQNHIALKAAGNLYNAVCRTHVSTELSRDELIQLLDMAIADAEVWCAKTPAERKLIQERARLEQCLNSDVWRPKEEARIREAIKALESEIAA